jgi:hypothetical protein
VIIVILSKVRFALLACVIFGIVLFGSTSSVSAKAQNTAKPGWGFGDVNHLHEGPPGLSVNPVNVTQTNTGNVTFTLGYSADTGGNTSSNNGNGASVVSGAVSSVFHFVVTMGQNIFGS